MFRNLVRGCDQSASPSEASVPIPGGRGQRDLQTPVGHLIQFTALVFQKVLGTLYTWSMEIKLCCMYSAVGSWYLCWPWELSYGLIPASQLQRIPMLLFQGVWALHVSKGCISLILPWPSVGWVSRWHNKAHLLMSCSPPRLPLHWNFLHFCYSRGCMKAPLTVVQISEVSRFCLGSRDHWIRRSSLASPLNLDCTCKPIWDFNPPSGQELPGSVPTFPWFFFSI